MSCPHPFGALPLRAHRPWAPGVPGPVASSAERIGAERPALAGPTGLSAFMPGRASGLLDGAPPRYSAPMKLSIELSAAQADRLRHEAERLGLSPEELARAVVADILATPDEDFRKAAADVVRKFEELYRRLA